MHLIHSGHCHAHESLLGVPRIRIMMGNANSGTKSFVLLTAARRNLVGYSVWEKWSVGSETDRRDHLVLHYAGD